MRTEDAVQTNTYFLLAIILPHSPNCEYNFVLFLLWHVKIIDRSHHVSTIMPTYYASATESVHYWDHISGLY